MTQEPDNEHGTPRVSPYRLAGHLASAFIIYGTLLWTSLTLAFPRPPVAASGAAAVACGALKRHALPLTCLMAVTAVSGEWMNCLSFPGPEAVLHTASSLASAGGAGPPRTCRILIIYNLKIKLLGFW